MTTAAQHRRDHVASAAAWKARGHNEAARLDLADAIDPDEDAVDDTPYSWDCPLCQWGDWLGMPWASCEHGHADS